MRVIFTRTRYKNYGADELLSQVVNVHGSPTKDEIFRKLIEWSDGKGSGDYSWEYEKDNQEAK